MIFLQFALGLLLGALGALGHLWVTRVRAALALERGPAFTLLTYPLALAAPAAAVILASQLSPLSAWVSPLGLLLARSTALRKASPR